MTGPEYLMPRAVLSIISIILACIVLEACVVYGNMSCIRVYINRVDAGVGFDALIAAKTLIF